MTTIPLYAVLVDADNVPHYCMQKVLHLLKSRGKIQIRQVFGDFTLPRLAGWKETCIEHNLEPVLVWQKNRKNSTDLKLCLSCAHMIHEHPEIKHYVIVSGDGDFTSVIQNLKQRGKSVICMGMEKNSSTALQKCCDEFIALSSVQPPSALESKVPSVSEVSFNNETKNTKTAIQKTAAITDAINRHFKSQNHAPINCGHLKQLLLSENPCFTEANFEQPSFTQLLKHLGYLITYNEGGSPFVIDLITDRRFVNRVFSKNVSRYIDPLKNFLHPSMWGAGPGTHLVYFSSPKCGHCKKFSSTWSQLKTVLVTSHPHVTLVNVNDTETVKQTSPVVRFFPTLRVYHNGNMVKEFDYATDGDRHQVSNITAFVQACM